MGAISYHLNQIRGKQEKKGTKSLTAQERAVMSRRREAESQDDLEDDTMTLEDDTTDSRRASGFGFFSWVGGLFSKDIAFTFNETQIKGKDNHQVRGGPVLLFNGVVLDLTPASMEGSISGDRQEVHPRKKGGTPAKLVVSPVNLNFMKEHRVDDFVMKAPKDREVDEFSAKIDQPVSYKLEDGGELKAEGAVVDKKQMTLVEPRLEKPSSVDSEAAANAGEITGAVINEAGLTYTEKAQGPSRQEETGGGGTPAGDTQLEALDNTSPANLTQGETEGTPVSAPSQETVGTSVPGRENTLSDAGEQNEAGERTNYLNLETGEFQFGEEGEGVSVSGDPIHKTFRFSWGKGWSSEDGEDEEGEKDKEPENVRVYEAAKNAAAESYGKLQESAEKLGFAKDALILFFQTGKLPENKYEKDGEKENETSKLALDAELMLCPGISFAVSLEPEWSFGFHFDFALEKSDKTAQIEVEMAGDRIQKITCPDMTRILSVTAEAMGKIGATLRFALRTGVGYLFYLEGGLFATGEAKGILKGGSENAFGKATVGLPIELNGADRKVEIGEANNMELEAGIGISGSIGGDVRAASQLFDWEKELCSYTFKEWHPADFKGMISLKHNKEKGGPFNPLSWEKTSSKFDISLFGKHIEGQKEKKFGLEMTDKTTINTKIDESKALKDRLVEIHNRLSEIETKMAAGRAGGQFAAENSVVYEELKKELESVSRYLINVMKVGGRKLEEMEEAVAEYQADKHYQSNTEKAKKGREKHEKRLQTMQTWGDQFGEGQEKERGLSAYTYYEANFGEAGALRQKKELHQETAKSSLASRDNLISYERQRIEELGRKHNERIGILKDRIDQMSAEEKNSPNPEFVKLYRKIGGGAFLETVQQYTGKEKLIAYEQGRMEKYAERHRERAKKLEEAGFDLSGENMKKPNRAFTEYYKKMGGKGFFAEDKLIFNHQNGKEIVDYEKSRLKERAGENMEHIEQLRNFKAMYDMAGEDEKKRAAVMKEARNYYESTGGGRLGHTLQKAINIANAASKQDILQYEIDRLGDYQHGAGEGQESFGAEEKALNFLRSGSGTDAGGADPLTGLEEAVQKQVWAGYKKWMEAQSDDILKEMIPLRLMVAYENSRKSAYENKQNEKKAQSKSDKTRRKPDKTLEKHDKRIQKLDDTMLLLQEEKNQETIESETEKAKKEYFSSAKGLLGEVRSGKVKDAELLQDVLERKAENYGAVHTDRITKLREFMGLEEGKNNAALSPKSDAQVWEFYKSIGGGSGFADAFKKQRKGSYSIDDMLRYEEHAARENSKTNAVVAAASRKVEAKIADYTTSEGGAAVEEKRKKEKEGGHYDRYMTLKGKWEGGASDAEIVELYLSMGGGKGYVKNLLKDEHFLDVVTPEEILRYEQTHSGKKGEQHRKRLEMLQGLDDTMTDEKVYGAYRESVLEDHAAKKFADRIGIRQKVGFDATVKAEDVVTPQMIFDYENRRVEELTGKHREREERLSCVDENENALSIYREMGGGEGFFNARADELKAKEEEIGASRNYEDIIGYERGRSDFYQKILDEINEPLKRIEAAKTELQGQLKKAQEDQSKLEKYLGENGKREAFGNPAAFRTFTDVSSGEEVQKNVENAEARVEALAAQAEAAQQEAEQLHERIENERLLEEDVS